MHVVFRHPKLPGQPYVLDTPRGDAPAWLTESGWQVDPETDPVDAAAEAAQTAANRAHKPTAAADPGYDDTGTENRPERAGRRRARNPKE